MTNIRAPKISVCIPTYNRADLLKQSVASVLNQTFYDYELIISDNASQDGTAEVIKSFNDSRIIYISKEKNIGLVNNWNSCLAEENDAIFQVLGLLDTRPAAFPVNILQSQAAHFAGSQSAV